MPPIPHRLRDKGSSTSTADLIHNALSTRSAFLKKYTDPRRDIAEECGHPREIGEADYRYMYDREGIAARVVEVLPRECWQVQPKVFDKGDVETQTEFEEKVSSLGKNLRGESWFKDEQGNPLWEHLKRLDELAGIGFYGILLIGFNDLDEGESLATPVKASPRPNKDKDKKTDKQPPFKKKDDTDEDKDTEDDVDNLFGDVEDDIDDTETFEPTKLPSEKGESEGGDGLEIIFLRTFDSSLVTIKGREKDLTNPRFGHPTSYNINFEDPSTYTDAGDNANFSTQEVHWSRVIHVADNLGVSEIFGPPRMQAVFNRIVDVHKLYGGSAEMYWRGAFPGLSFETHPQLGGDVEISEGLKDDMEQYMNGLQRYLALTGMSAKSLAPQVVDPNPQIDAQITAICIRLGIPKRKFMGTERGELSSSMDDDEWNDKLQARQMNFITPRIIVPFIDRLIELQVLPEPDEGYQVEWPDIHNLSDQVKAEILVKRVEAMAKFIQGGVEGMMALKDFYMREMHYTEEEADSIIDNIEEPEPLEEEMLFDDFGNPLPPVPAIPGMPVPGMPPGLPAPGTEGEEPLPGVPNTEDEEEQDESATEGGPFPGKDKKNVSPVPKKLVKGGKGPKDEKDKGGK
tara:strand:- start:3089 stop:4972 length:1884 start_codon:yes stop_codon:yes gene_type:complete